MFSIFSGARQESTPISEHFPYMGAPPPKLPAWQRPCKSDWVNSWETAPGNDLSAYARKLGISSSSLHRMEMGEQNVTLAALERLLDRLKCNAADVFDAR